MGQFTEDGYQGTFPTAVQGRLEPDVGAHIAQLESEGVQDPKSEGFGGPFGQDDETYKYLLYEIQEDFSVHRLRPGDDLREMQVLAISEFCAVRSGRSSGWIRGLMDDWIGGVLG